MVKTKKIQIKDLAIGMKIKTKDKNGDIVFKTVTDKWNTTVKQEDQVRLQFENGVVLNCSVNHPIMVWSESGSFLQKRAHDLTNEDRVLTDSGFTRLLVADFEQQNDANYIDITVEDTHTFFAAASETSSMVLTHNSQGGIRNASATITYPIWHYQFDDLIVLKNNQGTEETRVRHMDYNIVLSAFFWRRFKNKENITFFDPNEVPDLYEAFYSDTALFEKMYVANEQRTDIRKKIMSAEEVFKGGILKERTDTGRIYLTYIDNVQRQGPFDPATHPIYQSNLCLTGDTQIQIRTCAGEQTIKLQEFVEQYELGRFSNTLVKSYDINTGKEKWSQVSAAAVTATVTELIEIQDESGKVIKCTPDHQIYTKNRGYVKAGGLEETDVLCVDNHVGSIENLVEKYIQTTSNKVTRIKVDPVDVYDITVPETECFFANNILVHNCQEILLPTKSFKRLDDAEGRISLCTLGSINWGSFRHPEDMRRACRILHRSLNNILDYQDFLSIQSKLSNDEIRPLGIGITNLAYWHAKRGLKYGERDALAEVKTWMEHQAYYLTEATVELARERGRCEHSDRTRYGQGVFPWELRAKGVNELTDFAPELDWETLRANMKLYGVRNATQMAVAPVESSSVCINSTNGIEMPMSLISVKESKAGSFVQVVPEYHKLKNKYQLMWEQKDCTGYLKTAAVIAAYVDQSISTNTFYNPAHFPDRKVPTTLIAKNLMNFWYWGGKTLYYSLINKQGSKMAEDAPDMPLEVIDFDDEDGCESCKL